MGCIKSILHLEYSFLESYYFLCPKKTLEQSYRNMYLLIRKLIVKALYSVQIYYFITTALSETKMYFSIVA